MKLSSALHPQQEWKNERIQCSVPPSHTQQTPPGRAHTLAGKDVPGIALKLSKTGEDNCLLNAIISCLSPGLEQQTHPPGKASPSAQSIPMEGAAGTPSIPGEFPRSEGDLQLITSQPSQQGPHHPFFISRIPRKAGQSHSC